MCPVLHDITVLSKNWVYFKASTLTQYTVARSHTTQYRDFLKSISFSF